MRCAGAPNWRLTPGGKSIAKLATYLQSEISPFPDELVEMLSDEQYLINAAGVLFGDQRLSRVHGLTIDA